MEYLYKTADQEWLINLLKDGKLKTINKDWISLSLVEDSGGLDDYGNMTITFNKAMIMSETNAFEVDYEDPNFFDMFPTITKHVTGYNNEEEYYSDKGYDGPDEANEDGELTWEQYCEGYSDEQEVVIDEIIYKDGLIINVEFNEKPKPELLDLLKSKNIKYTINTIKEKISILPEVVDYKGFTINLKKSEKFKDSYMCSVYLNDEYKMGLRGPCDYNKGKEAAILFIDGQINNKNTIKENNTMKYVKNLFKKSTIINESYGEDFSIANVSRDDVNNIISLLNSNDISYDLDGPNEIISFDMTELSQKDQNFIQSLFKTNESENNNILEIKDFVSIVDNCVVLHINNDENRITKFDIIRMEAANFNCEIIGVDEDKVFIASKTLYNTKDIEDFKNSIENMMNESNVNKSITDEGVSGVDNKIVLNNIKDIDYTRIVKWMYHNLSSENYEIKSGNKLETGEYSTITILTNDISSNDLNNLRAYLKYLID